MNTFRVVLCTCTIKACIQSLLFSLWMVSFKYLGYFLTKISIMFLINNVMLRYDQFLISTLSVIKCLCNTLSVLVIKSMFTYPQS